MKNETNEVMTLELPAERGHLRQVRAFAVACCAGRAVDRTVLAELQIALTEAASNIVAHAYAGRSPGRMRIEAFWQGDELRFDITDTGRTFSPKGVDPEDGLGLYLLHQSVDRVRYSREDGQNHLELVKVIPD